MGVTAVAAATNHGCRRISKTTNGWALSNGYAWETRMISEGLIVTYLANIIKISRMDGEFTPEEQKAVEDILRRLGAKEKDLREALRYVARNGHTMTPVGRFSDKIRNLEDMLFVAVVDGDLSTDEKNEMLVFVKKIDITKDQVRTLLVETKAKINLQQATLRCNACGEVLTPDALFCTSCGTRIGR